MRIAVATALLALLTGCAAETVTQPGSPGAAVRATRPQAGSAAARPAASQAARPRAEVPGEAPGAPAEERAEDREVFAVLADGTVGCADPQAVRILRQLRGTEGASPRLLAQAHRDGRCMTVFRVSRWRAEGSDGDLIRLRLAEGGAGEAPVALYFMREDVAPPPAE